MCIVLHRVSKNKQNYFCYNYAKLPPNLTAPPPFRPGNPALCGIHPLVTPYYCRLGVCCVFCVYCVLIVFFLLIVYCILYVPSVL